MLGAGAMGPGRAQVFATAGHRVALSSRTEATLERAQATVAGDLAAFLRHGLLEEAALPRVPGRISPTTSLAEAGEGPHLGVKSGRGFCDYGDRDPDEVLAARDDALLGVFTALRPHLESRI